MRAISTPQLRIEIFNVPKDAIAKAGELAGDGFTVLAQGKVGMITKVKGGEEIDLEANETYVVVAISD